MDELRAHAAAIDHQARHGAIAAQRQIIRWLAHDYLKANERIVQVLGEALAAEDWEVRAGAMLAAARLSARPLAVAVRRVELPTTSREGLDLTDRKHLVAMRKAAASLLSGFPIPADPTKIPMTREDWQAHLIRCVAGAPVRTHDRIFLLSHALTQPLEEAPQPHRLPPGILVTETGYRLARSGLALTWVPPVAHWLGDALPPELLPSPIRQVTPTPGFFVAVKPLTSLAARRIAPEVVANAGLEDASQHQSCSLADAGRIVAALARREDLCVRLPTADEWEMAARGPDGRRYPWGNSLETGMLSLPSPWGCYDTVGFVGQWTCSITEAGEPIVCGTPADRCCAARFPAHPGERFTVRPVILPNEIEPAGLQPRAQQRCFAATGRGEDERQTLGSIQLFHKSRARDQAASDTRPLQLGQSDCVQQFLRSGGHSLAPFWFVADDPSTTISGTWQSILT